MMETEQLPEAFVRHRQSFAGGGIFALVVTPDGRGFRCHPVESGLEAEELSRDQMVAAIIELYGGIAPFSSN